MQHNQHKPDTGELQINKELAAIHEQVTACTEVLDCQMNRVTIVVQGSCGRESIKIFQFPPGAIPKEIKTFFETYGNRMAAEAYALGTEIPLVKVGNNIVSIEDFIKEYRSGIEPSISEEDKVMVEALRINAGCVIRINGIETYIQRIN